jgi:hypothetical protein
MTKMENDKKELEKTNKENLLDVVKNQSVVHDHETLVPLMIQSAADQTMSAPLTAQDEA